MEGRCGVRRTDHHSSCSISDRPPHASLRGTARVLFHRGADARRGEARGQHCICRNFIQDYGSTVAGCISSLYGPGLEARPTRSAGFSLSSRCKSSIEENRVLPTGEVGHIRVRTPGMAQSVYGGGRA